MENQRIEAIPFRTFKEKIRLVKKSLKVGKVEVDTDLRIILVIKEGQHGKTETDF